MSKLRVVSAPEIAPYQTISTVPYAIQPAAENPLANYEQAKGEDHAGAEVNRDDPWLRVLLMAQRGPLVIDLAVFIDGKPYRAAREGLIDELLAPAETKADAEIKAAAAAVANSVVDAVSQVTANFAQSGEADANKNKKKDNPDEDDKPGVAAQSRAEPTIRERLASYVAASGAEVDREEIRWLLSQWGAGPAVLVLAPSLSWQRAREAPLLVCLDEDGDGALTAAEMDQAAPRIQLADKDGDDVVTLEELRRLADRPAATPVAIGHPLTVVLDERADRSKLAAELSRLYGGESATGARDRELLSAPADVTLRVDLAAGESQGGGLSVLSANDEIAKVDGAVSVAGDSITMSLGRDSIEFLAARAGTGASSDAATTQVAIGAVLDGRPLFRVLDSDHDDRLTQRELRELEGLLNSLDRNQDRQITADEIPAPIRLAVTLGPNVHHIVGATAVGARPIAPAKTLAPPEWFTSMDRNGDRDLSREEFLGGGDQFRKFDKDNDGLLSVAEVLERDR